MSSKGVSSSFSVQKTYHKSSFRIIYGTCIMSLDIKIREQTERKNKVWWFFWVRMLLSVFPLYTCISPSSIMYIASKLDRESSSCLEFSTSWVFYCLHGAFFSLAAKLYTLCTCLSPSRMNYQSEIYPRKELARISSCFFFVRTKRCSPLLPAFLLSWWVMGWMEREVELKRKAHREKYDNDDEFGRWCDLDKNGFFLLKAMGLVFLCPTEILFMKFINSSKNRQFSGNFKTGVRIRVLFEIFFIISNMRAE
jgi:hypothetical protein